MKCAWDTGAPAGCVPLKDTTFHNGSVHPIPFTLGNVYPILPIQKVVLMAHTQLGFSETQAQLLVELVLNSLSDPVIAPQQLRCFFKEASKKLWAEHSSKAPTRDGLS